MSFKKIPTMNKMGSMVMNLSMVSQEFIMDSKNLTGDDLVLDIGCCYGVVTLEVLEKSKCRVAALDLEKKHLQEMTRSITETQKVNSKRVNLIWGKFPNVFSFKENSLSLIHSSHCLQFLKGEDIVQGLKKCFAALVPGGKIYVTTTSIYLSWLKSFIPCYKKRVNDNIGWPGEIENFLDYAPDIAKDTISNFFHVLTKQELKTILSDIGFIIEKCFYYDVDSPRVIAEDEKEMIGIIARKP